MALYVYKFGGTLDVLISTGEQVTLALLSMAYKRMQ